MNIKTTIALAFAVLVVALGYLIWSQQQLRSPQPEPAVTDGLVESAETAVPPLAEVQQERRLTQPPLTDDTPIVQVVYQRQGKPQMMFERLDEEFDQGTGEWMMIEPARCSATAWMINNVVLAVKRLKSATSYRLGAEGSVTLEQAGIRPEPVARFAVTSQEGKTIEIEVGNALIGQDKRYVHLPDRADELFVAEENFNNILDRELTEFREKKFFKFTAADAVEFEVIERRDGQVASYRLKKLDGDWRFVAPFRAKAESKKISEVINAMNRLWARTWLDAAPGSLAEFGLDNPYVELRVVTEKTIAPPAPLQQPSEEPAAEEDQEAAEDPPPEVQRETFAVALSQRTPIDDQSQIYAKRGDDEQVATINASELDKFVPRMSEWRNLRITRRDAVNATSLTIERPDGPLNFELRNNEWVFAETYQLAEPAELVGLLADLDLLRAVNFLDVNSEVDTGLDAPAAQVTLRFADVEQPEVILVGDFTEQAARRLRYAQRLGSAAVAKIKAKDIERVFQAADAYRNREILNTDESRIHKIELARELPASGTVQFLTLARGDDQVWRMTAPILSEVDLTAVNGLVKELAKWRGLRVVDELDPAKLGLTNPQIQVTLTVEPIRKITGAGEEPSPSTEESATPTIRQVKLSGVGDVVYAHRLDAGGFMEVDPAIADKLTAEFLDGQVWDVQPSQVVAFGSDTRDGSIEFRQSRGRWQYVLEPDIPINNAKVDSYLQKFSEIRTDRFVEYTASSLSAYGLDDPAVRFYVELESGQRQELLVSDMPYRGEGERHYATTGDGTRIFLLPPSVARLATLTLERFEPDA